MSDVSFVRRETLPELPPPGSEVGIVGWLRANLFSSVSNSILTIVSIYAIYSIITMSFPWFFNGVWNTSSLAECRQVLDGVTGGCFSVLTERWNQLVFGVTYPSDQYWRPTLAFVLLFVAAAPVLFFDLPRKLLIFTALYPFLAFWLVWGGAFWVPLFLILGFVLVYLSYSYSLARFGDGMALGAAFVVFLLWFGLLNGLANSTMDRVVGSMRMDSTQERIAQELELLPNEIASLEAEIETLDADIASRLQPAKDSGDSARIRTAISDVFADRQVLSTLRRDLGRMENNVSSKRNLLNRITGLPELEIDLPDLQRAEADQATLLPETVAGIISQKGLENLQKRNREESLGIPNEDFTQLETYLKARSTLVDAELKIERTYSDVARIGLKPVASSDIGGFMLNMILGVTCVSLSLPLGIALALGRQSKLPIIRWISVLFIEFIRGVPLITLLFVASVVLAYFFPPGSNLDLVLRVVIMITLFSAAYIAEVIRGGLAALPTGQYEAGDSLGLDYPQAMRLIILPQALKISIPGIVNVAVGLFKDTTLVSVISMFDLVGTIRGPIVSSTEWNGIYWELWLFAALLFFVVCYGISQYSQWLERRLATDHR